MPRSLRRRQQTNDRLQTERKKERLPATQLVYFGVIKREFEVSLISQSFAVCIELVKALWVVHSRNDIPGRRAVLHGTNRPRLMNAVNSRRGQNRFGHERRAA